MNHCIAVYCAGAWFCVEVFVGQNDAFSCSGQAGRCSGAAARGGAGAVLGHGVARSGGGGGAGMASSAIVRKERDRNVTINQENIGWDPWANSYKQNI